MGGLTFDFVHQEEGHVLVVNVQDEVGTALVDPLRQVSFHHL